MFIFLPSACEIKREEESKRKKGQEADGQCPARTVLLSFPVLTGKLLTLESRQATFQLCTKLFEIKRPIYNSHLLGMPGEQYPTWAMAAAASIYLCIMIRVSFIL